MKTITLIIGGVDVSEFIIASGYKVQKSWNIKTTFENYDGRLIAKRNGWSYQLKADFDSIPDELMVQLTAVLDSDDISITFTDPHSSTEDGCTTSSFERPQNTGGEVSCELDDGLYWDFTIDISSIFIAATGGDSL